MGALADMIRAGVDPDLIERLFYEMRADGAKFLAEKKIRKRLRSRGPSHRMAGEEWADLCRQVYDRDGFVCAYCGQTERLTIDHIVPCNRGGTHAVANLAVACKSCNSSKKDFLLSEWRGGVHAG